MILYKKQPVKFFAGCLIKNLFISPEDKQVPTLYEFHP